MEWTTGPAMEEERRVPVRARGAEDGGGAAGPSTVKGKRDMVKNFEEMVWFFLPPHAVGISVVSLGGVTDTGLALG